MLRLRHAEGAVSRVVVRFADGTTEPGFKGLWAAVSWLERRYPSGRLVGLDFVIDGKPVASVEVAS